MNRFLSAAVLALTLSAGAAFASGYEDTIRTSYEAAGYTNVDVHQNGDQWVVTADMNGSQFVFLVDPTTGASTDITGTDQGNALADDNGEDGTGVEAGDDNGTDGTDVEDDSSDDNSGSGTEDDSSDDSSDSGDSGSGDSGSDD